jgi:exonuclease SbcC
LSAIADIDCLAGEIVSYEKEIAALQEQINGIDVKITLQQKAQEEKDKLEADLKEKQKKFTAIVGTANTKGFELEKKKDTINNKIRVSETLLDRLPILRGRENDKAIAEADQQRLAGEIKAADDQLSTFNHDLNNILMIENYIKEKEGTLKAKQLSRTNLVDSLRKDLQKALKQSEYIKDSGCPIDNPTCRFMEAAVADRSKIPEIEQNIKLHIKQPQDEIDLETAITELKSQRKDPAELKARITAVTRLKIEQETTLKEKEKIIHAIAKELEALPLAEQAKTQLSELQAELAQVEEEFNTYKKDAEREIAGLKAEIDELTIQLIDATDTGPDYEKEKQDLKNQQTHFESEIFDARHREGDLKKTLGAIEEVLKQIEQAKIDLNILCANLDYYNNEIGQWIILEKAFGNDGIIALELDDAGPQISAIANELLQVFGGRFAIRIDTQTAKLDGKGNKEVFDITVFDNETNEQKSIKRLSGGEKTWIEDAVTKAICIYNKQASGRQFKTIATDEKDGALDAEKKKEFFAMKRRVLELGGYEREICITQTPELLAMADAIITLKKGGIEITVN